MRVDAHATSTNLSLALTGALSRSHLAGAAGGEHSRWVTEPRGLIFIARVGTVFLTIEEAGIVMRFTPANLKNGVEFA